MMAVRKASSPALDNPRKLVLQLPAQTTPLDINKDSAQQHALGNSSITGIGAWKYSCSR
jgi:hypothetical protein